MNRREMLKQTGLLGILLAAGPALGEGPEPASTARPKRKILVAGAHPDDPELGCGGTIHLLVRVGHDVLVYYLTRGGAGIPDLSPEQAREVRMREAQEACKILGARCVFGNQRDGDTRVDRQAYAEILQFVEKEAPDLVFTHWPIDTHPDHRACALLFYNAWLNSSRPFDLYYYEVATGHETQGFRPEIYVDITEVAEVKHRACFAHRSQKLQEGYARHHGLIEAFRGRTNYRGLAEAFAQQLPNRANELAKLVR